MCVRISERVYVHVQKCVRVPTDLDSLVLAQQPRPRVSHSDTAGGS